MHAAKVLGEEILASKLVRGWTGRALVATIELETQMLGVYVTLPLILRAKRRETGVRREDAGKGTGVGSLVVFPET
jgi:hypothetical protein